MKKVIATKNAPAAIGPYSQAVQVGNMLFAEEWPGGNRSDCRKGIKQLSLITNITAFDFKDSYIRNQRQLLLNVFRELVSVTQFFCSSSLKEVKLLSE